VTSVQLVRTRLTQIAGVTALVSTRIYALRFLQNGTLPAIRLTQVGGEEPMQLRGSVGWLRARVQVDCAAKESTGTDPFASAHAVMAAVHGPGDGTGLCGFRGTVDSVEVTGILPEGMAREHWEGDELRQVMVSRDYYVHFRAA
jgi:hypothetical protein